MTDLLLSSAQMNSNSNEIWKYSVIIAVPQSDRTLGFVMNQPVMNIDHKQITQIYGLKHTLPKCTVYCGGPVHTEKATIIHSPDWRNVNTQKFSAECYLTFDDNIIRDIAGGKGPRHWKVMLGYSEWMDGQLDAEIIRPGGWMLQDWDDIAWSKYKRKDKMWRRLIEKQTVSSTNQFFDQVFKE